MTRHMEKDITLNRCGADMLFDMDFSWMTHGTDTDCSGWSQLRPGRHLADLNQRAHMTNKENRHKYPRQF